jgi:hypothetical protein
LGRCDSLVSTVTILCPATAFEGGNSFATRNAVADCYTKGIKIAGQYTEAIIARFLPLSSNNFYRKLIAAN